jgi:hypothetical protein
MAASFSDPIAKSTMYKVAESFDNLADLGEEQRRQQARRSAKLHSALSIQESGQSSDRADR